jgi:AcrR family transcriptional regulator
MTQTRRERLREATREEIKTAAHEQMKAEGAAALSLRAIGRALGMTAPALYRYYHSRDDLITALIIDAYHSQAATLEAACAALPPADHAGRLRAFILAYREWAISHPEDYKLIYGTPIPGYHAPWELTAPAAQRNMRLVLDLLKAAWQAGALTLPAEYIRLSPPLRQKLAEAAAQVGYDVPLPILYLAIVSWGYIQGLISLELFGHLVMLEPQAGEVYRLEAEAWLKRLGLSVKKRGK